MNLKLKSKPCCAINITILVLLLILNSNAILFNAQGNTQNFTFIYRDYLRNMMDIVDHEMQPCWNFFQHACANFENFQKGDSASLSNEEDESDRYVAPFLYNKQDQYRFFETHKQLFNTIPGILLRDIYDLCKSSFQQSKGKRKIWRDMLNDIPFLKSDHDLLRKWPFLQYQWEKYETKFNLSWPALAAELSAHGINTFVNIFFAENTIYVAPNDELQCPTREEFIASLVPLLGRRNIQIADIVGGEIWLLCHQLKGKTDISHETDGANMLMDDSMNVFFQQLFKRLNLTDTQVENSRKIIIYLDKLDDVLSLMHFNNPRIVYNFIIWQAYQQIVNIDDCFDLTHEFEGLLQVEYWHWYAFDNHLKRDVAMALYLFHTTRFQKHYRQFIISSSWERLFQHRAERKDLNIERSIKNYAKQHLDLESYSSILKSKLFSSQPPKFYSHLLELRRLKMRYSFLRPYKETADLEFFKEFLSFTILLLHRPRLHYFASYDLKMWQNSKLLQSSDGYYAALDCLNQQTALNSEDSPLYEQLDAEMINSIFNFYSAFIEALADYKFWLDSENFAIAEDFILEYFNLDSTKVMFYAVAQQFCYRNDVIHKALINRSYMNMPEFQEAFQCTSSDDMNPITKCMINHCLSN